MDCIQSHCKDTMGREFALGGAHGGEDLDGSEEVKIHSYPNSLQFQFINLKRQEETEVLSAEFSDQSVSELSLKHSTNTHGLAIACYVASELFGVNKYGLQKPSSSKICTRLKFASCSV